MPHTIEVSTVAIALGLQHNATAKAVFDAIAKSRAEHGELLEVIGAKSHAEAVGKVTAYVDLAARSVARATGSSVDAVVLSADDEKFIAQQGLDRETFIAQRRAEQARESGVNS